MSLETKNTALTMPDRIGVPHVMQIAWPIMLSMLSFTAMNFVNALWVGPLGKAHLAAAGIGGVLLYAIHGFGYGVLTGLKIATAQAHGAGDDLLARRLLWHGLRLALWMGLLEFLFIPLGGPLLRLLGASEAVAPLAEEYFAMRVFGGVFAFIMTALTQYLQGRGRTVAPMVAMIVANVFNVVLDPMFIYGFGPIPAMGIGGAGIAASISFGFGALYLLWVAQPELTGTPRTFDRALLGRIWTFGFPLGGRATLEIASYLTFTGILASMGDEHLAAHVIVVRTISVSFLPGYAISEAVSVLVGQAIGARRIELVKDIQRAGLKIAVTFMCACGLVFVLFPAPLAAIHGATADVVAIAIELFMISAVFQVFDAFAMTGLGVLNGAGDTRFVLIATVTVAWFAKLPLGWYLATEVGLGAAGAWWGIVAEVFVLWGVVAWRVRSGRWRRVADKARVKADEEEALAAAF